MEQKSAYLDLTIISAADLQRKWLSGGQTVALAWVDPSAKKTTSIVSGNGSNVQWHEKLILSLNGFGTVLQSKLLTIEIHARGAWGDSLLGSVYVPLVDLVSDEEKRGNTTLMYQIVQPSGKRQGSMKFFAKVKKPRMIAPLSSAECASNSAVSEWIGLGSNALYPPASAMCPAETNDERLSSEVNSPYPTLEGSPYPLQLHFSQNYPARHDAGQDAILPDPSYGVCSYPPHVYPPVNTTYSLHTSPAPCSTHSNYTGMIPYPPPSLPVLETSYLPTTTVYSPPTLFSEAPCPPIASHSPHPLMYSPASFDPYSNFSSPLYPPPYPHQQATVHYPYPHQQATVHYPYPSYCGSSF